MVEHEDGVDLCGLPIPEKQAGERLHAGSHGHNDSDNNDVEVDFDVSVPKACGS